RPRQLQLVRQHPWPPAGTGEARGIYYPRLRRDGWELVTTGPEDGGEHRIWRRTVADGPFALLKKTVETEPAPGKAAAYELHSIQTPGGAAIDLPDVDWAEFDPRGRLVFTRRGALW